MRAVLCQSWVGRLLINMERINSQPFTVCMKRWLPIINPEGGEQDWELTCRGSTVVDWLSILSILIVNLPWISNRWLPLHMHCERLTVNPPHVDCWSPTPHSTMLSHYLCEKHGLQLVFSRMGFIFSIILPWFGYCH